jgi:hypothetical protein
MQVKRVTLLFGFLVWSLLLGCLIGFLVSGLTVALFGLFGLGFLWVLGCFLGFWLGYLRILSCVLGGAMCFFDLYNITYKNKK